MVKYIQKTIIPKKYIISYKHEKKQNWDVFILLLALQNSLLVPIQLAFKPDALDAILYVIFDNLVDILFIVDMAVMFLTSFLNNKG